MPSYLPQNAAAHHLQIMQALLARRRHRRSHPQESIKLGTPKADILAAFFSKR